MHLKYGLLNIDTGDLVDRLFLTKGLAFQWLRQYKADMEDQDTYRIILVSEPIEEHVTLSLGAQV